MLLIGIPVQREQPWVGLFQGCWGRYKKIQPEYVIHLAAITPVSYSYEHAQEVTEVNYIGTINLIEACLREVYDFKQFLFPSTSNIIPLSVWFTWCGWISTKPWLT